MDERLRNAARTASERGLGFLEGAVTPEGRWPSWRYDNTRLVGPRHLEYPAFTAALGVLALGPCQQPGARAVVERSRNFVLGCMEFPGIWRYPTLPPSVDDTAICALAVGAHPWLRMGRLAGPSIAVLLAHRDDDGLFPLWAAEDWPEGLENEVDAVVNANVLAFVGDREETRAARSWLADVVADRREAAASPYYIEAVDLHFALARAGCFRDGLFGELRSTLSSRMLARLAGDEGFADPMRTAQALSGLDMLAVELDPAVQDEVVGRLIDAQRDDGSWRPCLAWKEPPGWAEWIAATEGPEHVKEPRGFAAETLTTAFCIEALERAVRSSG